MSALISPIAGVIQGAENLLNPLISDAINQKYEKDKQNRLERLETVLNLPDSVSRAFDLDAYFLQLCTDAGTPTGDLGTCISVPLEVLRSLGTIAINKIYQEHTLASFEQKSTR